MLCHQLLNACCKLLFRHDGGIADPHAVIVDRLRRLVQESCNLSAVSDAETHKGIDAQLGGQQLSGGGINASLGSKQLVELLDKVGEDVKKYRVKSRKERFHRRGPHRLG